MRYSEELLEKLMSIFFKKMQEFLNPDWHKWSEWEKCASGIFERKWSVRRLRNYIESVGGSLVEDPYPQREDRFDMHDDEWGDLCIEERKKLADETGMFPLIFPQQIGRYRACLLPPEFVDKVFFLGEFP